MTRTRSSRWVPIAIAGVCLCALGIAIRPSPSAARGLDAPVTDGTRADVLTPAITPDAWPGPRASLAATAPARSDALRLLAVVTEAPTRDELPSPGVVRPTFGFGPVALWAARNPDPLDEPEPDWKSREFRLEPGPRNYKGQRVEAASTRYFQDFEINDLDVEWRSRGRIGSSDEFGAFLGPTRVGSHTLNVEVQPSSSYMVRFDIYLLGNQPVSPETAGTFRVTIDGVPLLEKTFIELIEENHALNASDEDFDERIISEIVVPFVSVAEICEIKFSCDAERVLGVGSWGLDNVLVERAVLDPGSFAGGGSFPTAGRASHGGGRTDAGGAFTRPENYSSNASIRGNPTGSGGGSRPRPFDLADLIDELTDPEEAGEPDDDTPTPDDPGPPDDDPPVEEAVPSPGTSALLVMASLAAMRRRRRGA